MSSDYHTASCWATFLPTCHANAANNALASCKSTDRKNKRYFSADPSGAQPCNHPWGILASPAGGRCWLAAMAASPAPSGGLPQRLAAWRSAVRRGLDMLHRIGKSLVTAPAAAPVSAAAAPYWLAATRQCCQRPPDCPRPGRRASVCCCLTPARPRCPSRPAPAASRCHKSGQSAQQALPQRVSALAEAVFHRT